jgi:hypothetical protein
MHYLTQYYKNLSEQLQSQVNQLERLLENASGSVGDSAIHKRVAAQRAKMSPEERAKEAAAMLDEVNKRRAAKGEKPFASLKDYETHAKEENARIDAERHARTKADIEAYAQSPEGKAHVSKNKHKR